MTAPVTDPTPTPSPAPPAPPTPTPPDPTPPAPVVSAPLHDDPAIAKALEGLTPEQRETLLTQGGRNALAARAQEVKDAKAAAQTAAEQARTELAQTIGKALGLVEDAAADPTKLTEALTASQAQAKQAQLELAVVRAAPTANGNAAALLDSRAFMATIADLDPQDPAALAAAITDAVTANPSLAAPARLPAPNPAQGSGGGGPTDPGQLTKADVERLAREGKNAEIEQARRDGRLNTLLGIKP